MKILLALVLGTLLFSSLAFSLTATEAKQVWLDAKQTTLDKQQAHNYAKIDWAANKSTENNQKVVDTGKDSLNAALDEVDAWLVYADMSSQENPEISDTLKQTISTDVSTNRDKIVALRADVAGVSNQVELGLVWLKMVGKYFELLSDVARDTGYAWVETGNKYSDKLEDYEIKIRTEAGNAGLDGEITTNLDLAHADIVEARSNLAKAKTSYDQVRLPGTPLVKFNEGNSYLRVAQANLVSSYTYLVTAYNLMVKESG
jgi:hypothetical protein